MRIHESEIVKHLIPDMKTQVVHVGIVQKQTDAGEMTRFDSLVAIGNEAGWFGLGKGKAAQMRIAIDKATNAIPKRNTCQVRLWQWECRCAELHSIPFKVRGKGGSVTIEIIPGPRGLGLVAGENIRNLLKLAGIKDAWTKSFGSTNTMMSTTKAIFNAIRSIYNDDIEHGICCFKNKRKRQRSLLGQIYSG